MIVRIALAVPSPHDERLALEARRHGHEVVVTAVDADDLESALVPVRPEADAGGHASLTGTATAMWG